jgi:hypothetical protein
MFACLKTGVGGGALTQSSSYYGPFNGPGDADVFVENVRHEIIKLGDTAPMKVQIVDEVPNGWSALPPESFQGFMRT